MRNGTQLTVILLLAGGLVLSSFYVNCLDHAVDSGMAGHRGLGHPAHADVSPSTESHSRPHADQHTHRHPDSSSEGAGDDASPMCHVTSHASTSGLLLIETVCDRCGQPSEGGVPKPDSLTLRTPNTSLRSSDPHLASVDRPPISSV